MGLIEFGEMRTVQSEDNPEGNAQTDCNGSLGRNRIVEPNTGKMFISQPRSYGSFLLVKEATVEKGQS